MIRILSSILLISVVMQTVVHAQTTEITTHGDTAVTVQAPSPVLPVQAPPVQLGYSVWMQTVPIMEIVGIHADVRLLHTFGDGGFRSIGIRAGIGYSLFTPHFAPVMLQALWGSVHNLEVCIGTSIPLNPVYGTHAEKPLTWRNKIVNPTASVGYRYESPGGGVQYRAVVNLLYLPGPSPGVLPSLGGSIGWWW